MIVFWAWKIVFLILWLQKQSGLRRIASYIGQYWCSSSRLMALWLPTPCMTSIHVHIQYTLLCRGIYRHFSLLMQHKKSCFHNKMWYSSRIHARVHISETAAGTAMCTNTQLHAQEPRATTSLCETLELYIYKKKKTSLCSFFHSEAHIILTTFPAYVCPPI